MVRTSKVSQNAAKAARKSQVASKKAALKTLCKCVYDDEQENGGKLPYGYMTTFIEENKKIWTWMTRDTMLAAYRRFKLKLEAQKTEKDSESKPAAEVNMVSGTISTVISDLTGDSALSSTSSYLERSKGGRPVGTTVDRKRLEKNAILEAKNEITVKYKMAVDAARAHNRNAKRGYLSKLIADVKKKRKIEHVDIPLKTIQQRVFRKNEVIHHSPGLVSPLLQIEDTVVKFVIRMAEIRQSLTPSRGLALINSLITDTPIQKELEIWKEKYSNNKSGSVGQSYWRAFLKRNAHKIISKRGQKYELDRQNWTTYANFVNMYDQCIEQMVRAGVAKKRIEPAWMDEKGQVCDESQAYGCKVTHDLIHPDWCLVGDEVGGNISMKGDGHAGGRLYLAPKGSVAYRKFCKADRKFTLIGLTSLDGQPVMCIVIIQGTQVNRSAEVGIDISIEPQGDPEDPDFFLKNSGPGKYFPGGPVCHFKGKNIPPMVRWSESGSITSEILADVLKTLDKLEVFPRSTDDNHPKPFLLVDGHQSRLQLPFLQYINEPEDNWVVCLGVPYGTALWQVGDSKEQNGSFNISMTKAKMDLLELKEKKCMNQNHSVTDIIPLINKSWSSSFSRIDKNQKAIADRGWFPLNRNLLMMPEIRATMTANERQIETGSSSIILPNKSPAVKQQVSATSVPESETLHSTTNNTDTSTITMTSSDTTKPAPSLNFNTGTASFVLDAIVQHEDLQKARERIKREQEDGKSVSEKLKKSTKITAGIIWKCGTNHLGKNILDVMKQDQVKKYQAEKEKIQKAESAYLKMKHESDALIATGKAISQFNLKELTTIIKPYKRNGDKALPKKKDDIIKLYDEWKNRPPREFDYSAVNEFFASMTECNDTDDANSDNIVEL